MLSWLPALNACWNAAAASLLVLGYVLIRRGRSDLHRLCMVAAFCCSTLFLAGYLYYHARAGIVYFHGTGWLRPLYFSILTTHTILAVVILPLVLRTLWLARSGRFEVHRRWARWTLPLWLYVSVTGVVVYGMLFHL